MLDACEFLWVGYDTNGSNPLCFHFNGQHEIGAIIDAKDQGRLTIDCCQLNMGVLWQKAPGSSQAKACHRLTPMKRASRRSFDLTTAIGPQGDLFRQHIHQRGHLPCLNRLQKTGEQLPLGVRRSWEAWPMLGKM